MKRFFCFVALAAVFLLSPVAWGQVLFVAAMDSAQETPPTVSHAQGTAWLVLDADMSSAMYSVTFAHLDTTFTVGHFHVGLPGVPGGVVFPLAFAGNTAKGTWSNIPDSLVRALLQGRLYANVHSRKYPGGEIRGQFKMVSGAGFSISMSDSQETPATGSGATGTGWAWLDTTGHIRYRVTIAGLSDTLTVAHFHIAPPGVSGRPVYGVTFSDSTSQDSAATFPDSLLIQALKGNVYFNVHSKAHPGGEIRGQLVEANGIRFSAWLDGAHENPPTTSKAQATAWGTLSQDLATLTYRVTYAHLDTTFTASHFHVAPSGTVVHPIAFTGNTSQGTWTSIPDSLLLALVKGSLYLNIHSKLHPGGEIAGFVKVAQGVEFTISMDASQETPPTGTGAMGTGWAVLDSGGTRISYRATIAGLSDSLTASHFHTGPVGVPGSVVHGVSFTDSTTQGTWAGFADSIFTDLVKGGVYLNVHSNAHRGGEIRGNLLYRPALSTGIEPVAGSAVPTSFTLEQNYPNPFNPSTAIQFQLSQASHVSLKVFNLLGQEVATLVNDVKQAGVYRVTFDASRLASGVYFYRLATDNGLVASKKMVLIK